MAKPKVATTSLAGCFGCHMSVLDIDERILKLIELVEFDKSPIDDIKKFTGRCLVGLIEGGCCNEENVHVLQDFREHCDVLISVGDCATMGGIPALRNTIPLKECLDEAYLQRADGLQPDGRDSQRPGAPAAARQGLSVSTRWSRSTTTCPAARPRRTRSGQALAALLSGKPIELPYELIKYD